MYGGVTTADDLMKIAEVAKKYDVPLVKLQVQAESAYMVLRNKIYLTYGLTYI